MIRVERRNIKSATKEVAMKLKEILTLRNTMLAVAVGMFLTVAGANATDKYFGQVSTAPDAVHIAGEEVFSISAPAGGFTALERAIIVERNINNALKASIDRSPSAVSVIHINNIPVVRVGGFHVVTADSNCAKLAGTSMEALADSWADNLRKCLADQTKISAYVASLSGDYVQPFVQYRRARLEAARLNHAAVDFREAVPPGLVCSDSVSVDGMKILSTDPVAAGLQFRKAIAMCPDNSKAHFGLGLALMQQGKVDEAIDSLQMARWLDPDYTGVHIALGEAFETKGLKMDAVKQYREAALLQPDNPEPYLLIADIREDRNDMGLSVAELTGGLKQIPDSEYIYLKRKDQLTWRLRRPF
jgi:tetratricopeptide (TPR) repeat protein